MKKQGIKGNDNIILIINGTNCYKRWCDEYGCEFPNCAKYTGEKFYSEKEARIKYPKLEIIKT